MTMPVLPEDGSILRQDFCVWVWIRLSVRENTVEKERHIRCSDSGMECRENSISFPGIPC